MSTPKYKRVAISEQELQTRVAELGAQITKDYEDKESRWGATGLFKY